MSTSRWDPDDDQAGRLLERFGRVGNVLTWVFLPLIALSAVTGLRYADSLAALLTTGILWWGGVVTIILRLTRKGWARPPPQVAKRPDNEREMEELRHMLRGHNWRSWRAGAYFFLGLAALYVAVGVLDADRRDVLLTCVAVWSGLALLCGYLSWSTLRSYRRGLQEPA
ncbi:MAG TPA: hypothetical protein VFY76_15880, partial [Nocardioides sp.]|nr:hypothetical protein [Nocardioides sp.]